MEALAQLRNEGKIRLVALSNGTSSIEHLEQNVAAASLRLT